MIDDLRSRIAAAIGSVDDWRGVTDPMIFADAIIHELNLREEWATEESLLLGIVKGTRTSDSIAYRIGSPWQEIDCGTEEKG